MAYRNKRMSATKRAYLAGLRKGKKIGRMKGKYPYGYGRRGMKAKYRRYRNSRRK